MGRIVTKLVTQGLLLLGPIITLNWSILSLLGYGQDVNLNFLFFGIAGPKEQVEFKLRVFVTAFGLLLVFGSEIFEYYLPKRDFRDFRNLYLENEAKTWRETLRADIRINILHVYRPGRYLWLIPVFRWTWNDGFRPPNGHFDVNLYFTTLQGVCGRAYRSEKAVFVDFREEVRPPRARSYQKWPPFRWQWFQLRNWPPFNPFHLWPWQLTKCGALKGVLSVPILKEIKRGGLSADWRAVGVLNLDSMTDEGTEFLKKYRNQLSEYFVDYGKILASLR